MTPVYFSGFVCCLSVLVSTMSRAYSHTKESPELVLYLQERFMLSIVNKVNTASRAKAGPTFPLAGIPASFCCCHSFLGDTRHGTAASPNSHTPHVPLGPAPGAVPKEQHPS